jgi:hypothetical protein
MYYDSFSVSTFITNYLNSEEKEGIYLLAAKNTKSDVWLERDAFDCRRCKLSGHGSLHSRETDLSKFWLEVERLGT